MDSSSNKVTELKRSGGPRSSRGKRISAQNSMTHGLWSKTPPFLTGPDKDTFDEIMGCLLAEYQPQGLSEGFFCQQLAMAIFRLLRLWGLERAASTAAQLEEEKESVLPHPQKAATEIVNRVGLNPKSKAALALIENGLASAKVASTLPDEQRLVHFVRHEKHLIKIAIESIDRLNEILKQRQNAPSGGFVS